MSKFNKMIASIMRIDAIQRQSMISFMSQIILTAFGFISTMYFAHTIGASVLGQYYLFVSYFTICSMITDFGLAGAAIKRISEGEDKNAYFSTFFTLRTGIIIITILIIFLFYKYWHNFQEEYLALYLIIALFISIFDGALLAALQGCGKIGIQATSNLINNIVRIITQITAIYIGFRFNGLAFGYILGIFTGVLLQFKYFDLRLTTFTKNHVKNLLSFSFWSFLIASGILVFSTSDTIMIGYYLTNSDVGVYRVALQITTVAGFTAVALRSTLWPRINRWNKIQQMDLIEKSLSKAITYSLILALPMLVGAIMLGDKILYYFYGNEFVNGYSSLIILLLVQIINIFFYIGTTYLTAFEIMKDLFKITLFAMVANILLNALLIPLIGIAGAALATLITMTMNAILALKLLSNKIEIKLEFKSIKNLIISTLIMGTVITIYRYIIPINSIFTTLLPIFIGFLIYITCIYILDENITLDCKKMIIKNN